MKPRILCLLQLPPPVHGAAMMNEAVTRSSVIQEAFELDVLPMRFARSTDDIRRLSLRKLVGATTLAVELTRRLVTRRPEALYFTFTPAGAGFYRDCAYVAAAKLAGVPVILHLHGKGIATYASRSGRRWLRDHVFAGAHVIVLSDRMRFDIADVAASATVNVVPNGIADRATTPARGRTPRILFLSTMAEDKGPLVLLEALAVLAERGMQFDATFAGADYDGCVARFNQRVQQLALQDRVRYVGPAYDNAKDRLFASHDVFALPSKNEALPLVILEAMQWSMPVVATAQGGIPDLVADEENGFLIDDVTSLADRLQQLLGDELLRHRMGAEGRRRYVASFTLSVFESRLRDVLLRALGRAPSQPASAECR